VAVNQFLDVTLFDANVPEAGHGRSRGGRVRRDILEVTVMDVAIVVSGK